MDSNRPLFKILSIDGGGIKGIIPCILLNAIEERIGKISSNFDLIAGTSTGGIIALGLSKPDPLSTMELLDFYKREGKNIFSTRKNVRKNSFFERIGKGFAKRSGNEILFAPFPSDHLESLLTETFSDYTLSECKNHVLITSYNVDNQEAIYFNSRTAINGKDPLLKDVARSTSAAPLFFTPNQLNLDSENDLQLIDGGVFANNPSILAYIEGLEIWKRQEKAGKTTSSKDTDLDIAPLNHHLPILMISIGTGVSQKQKTNFDNASQWNGYQWIKPLLQDVFMNSVSENTEYIIRHLLPDHPEGERKKRYIRLNISLPPEHMDMSDASAKNIQALETLAQEFVDNNQSLFDSIGEYF
jgi:patatin-like phospholipase/acyl hydrolase